MKGDHRPPPVPTLDLTGLRRTLKASVSLTAPCQPGRQSTVTGCLLSRYSGCPPTQTLAGRLVALTSNWCCPQLPRVSLTLAGLAAGHQLAALICPPSSTPTTTALIGFLSCFDIRFQWDLRSTIARSKGSVQLTCPPPSGGGGGGTVNSTRIRATRL